MEIDIKDQIKNPLLNRTEIHFDCLYQGEATPKLLDVKNKLVAMLDADKKLIVVDKILPTFGEGRAKGYAKIYDSEKNLIEIEPKNIIEKNQGPQKEEEAEEKAQTAGSEAEEKPEVGEPEEETVAEEQPEAEEEAEEEEAEEEEAEEEEAEKKT